MLILQVTFAAAKDAGEPKCRELIRKLSSALDAPSERSLFSDLEEIVPLQRGCPRALGASIKYATLSV